MRPDAIEPNMYDANQANANRAASQMGKFDPLLLPGYAAPVVSETARYKGQDIVAASVNAAAGAAYGPGAGLYSSGIYSGSYGSYAGGGAPVGVSAQIAAPGGLLKAQTVADPNADPIAQGRVALQEGQAMNLGFFMLQQEASRQNITFTSLSQTQAARDQMVATMLRNVGRQ